MTIRLKEVDRVEILTLQDNYIDIAAHDGTDIVRRARSTDKAGNRVSILAEHGFSAVVSLGVEDKSRAVLFDFGFSPDGALRNAKALGVDFGAIEALVLSHGHMDHHGGLEAFLDQLGPRPIELVAHPAVFREKRFIKRAGAKQDLLPPPVRSRIEGRGVRVTATREPRPLLDGALLYLGEIPRRTAFEKGIAGARYIEKDAEVFDPIEDDSAVVAHLSGRGLVVLSGCAHSGIVNTLACAREVTGIDRIHAVMGGFHLTGAEFEPAIAPTAAALKEIDPRFIIPTHCTGRRAVIELERAMPAKFLLNMSGTRMVFEK
jgi:7,8-dihydropterin-6-yl-methyl-4-(beta-D-ribofuranosyl)aminobenzene 5'-phosphate synthase